MTPYCSNIKTSYPKSWEKLRKWGTDEANKIVDIVKNSIPPEEAFEIDYLPELKDEELDGMITFYTRRLYDFFDINHIYIYAGMDEHNGFAEVNEELPGFTAPTRAEAEEEAFKQAFKILEEKL